MERSNRPAPRLRTKIPAKARSRYLHFKLGQNALCGQVPLPTSQPPAASLEPITSPFSCTGLRPQQSCTSSFLIWRLHHHQHSLFRSLALCSPALQVLLKLTEASIELRYLTCPPSGVPVCQPHLFYVSIATLTQSRPNIILLQLA
jgi:hypothetical protein